MNNYLSPAQAGQAVFPTRTAQTVRLWCKDGLVHDKDGKGHFLIKRSDLVTYCQKNGIKLKDGE